MKNLFLSTLNLIRINGHQLYKFERFFSVFRFDFLLEIVACFVFIHFFRFYCLRVYCLPLIQMIHWTTMLRIIGKETKLMLLLKVTMISLTFFIIKLVCGSERLDEKICKLRISHTEEKIMYER